MKILVVGSHGMAGHVITKYLSQQGHTVSTVARNNATYTLDIENIGLTSLFFDEIKNDFDFIINCIGLLVKDSNDRPDRAAIINSWFPHYIAHCIKDSTTKLIHLSTDCVFDGLKGNYIESDTHTEMNSYGSSKSLGEVNNNKDITFRMSIIGPELKNGTGLLNWVLTSNQKELQGWENALWNGLTTLQLAKCVEQYINNPAITGVYHLVNNDVNINKYDLLCKINEIYGLNKIIIKSQGPKSINKILIDTRNDFNFNIVNYDDMINEMKEFIVF
jgi:dTDP-4-dehydrorhamnose reductase